MPKVVKSVFKAVTSVLGTILSAFIKMPKVPKQDVGSLDATQTIQRRLQNGAPREVLIGRRIVGGVGSFDNSRGVDLETGERISIFSAVPCTAFHKLYMDGEAVTLSGDPTTGWVTITSHFLGKNDVPRASFRLWLGDNNAGLGADLKTLYPSLWNTYNELTELNDIDDHNGLCLGMLRGVNTNDDIGDEDDPDEQQGKNFIPFRGFPEFRVELSGAKLCDTRNGGVYSDPSTYAYSANSGLADGQFQHGWFGGENGDKLIAGLGYAGDFEDLLDKNQIEDNADYCDLKEFECHGVITSGSRQDGQNIRDTFNGILVESLAKIRTVPEGNRPHYGTIDFANYPAARVKRYDEDGYSTEVYNATQTKYIEPLEKYSEKDLPELTKTEWIVEDGGEINYLKQTLPLVADSTQAARIEKADLFTSRLQANGEVENLPLIPFEDYAVGGTVTLANTDVPAMNGRTWSIEGYAETPEGYINFILREYSPLTHDFDETDVPDTRPNVAPPRDPDFPPRPFANPGTLATVRLAGVSVIIQESWVEGASITATKTGSTASISISAHTRHYTDKAAGLDIDAATLTGLPLDSFRYIYYDDADRAGGAVTYQTTTDRPTARTSTDNPSRHYVGYVTTPAETGPTSTTGTTATPPTQVPERVPNADLSTDTSNVGGTPSGQVLSDIQARITTQQSQLELAAAQNNLTAAFEQADDLEAQARLALAGEVDDVNLQVSSLSDSTENNRIDQWPNGFANGLADWTQTSSVTALPSESVPPAPGIWALNQFGNLVNLIGGTQSIFMKYKGPVPPARKHAQISRMRVTANRTGGGTARALVQTLYYLSGTYTGFGDSTIIDLQESDGFKDYRVVMPNAQTVVHDATFTRVLTNLNSGDDAVWEIPNVTIRDVDETEKLDARAEFLEAAKVSADADRAVIAQNLTLLGADLDAAESDILTFSQTQTKILGGVDPDSINLFTQSQLLNSISSTINDGETGLGAVNSSIDSLFQTTATQTAGISANALAFRRLQISTAVAGELAYAEGLPGYTSNQFTQDPEAESPVLNEWVYTAERGFPSAKLTGFPAGTNRAFTPLKGLTAEYDADAKVGAKYEATVTFQIENTSGIASNDTALLLRIRNYQAGGTHVLNKAGLSIDRGTQGVLQTVTLPYTADSSDIMLKPVVESDSGLNTGVRIYIKSLVLRKIDARLLVVEDVAFETANQVGRSTFTVEASTSDPNTARLSVGAFKENGTEYNQVIVESDFFGFRAANGKGFSATGTGVYSDLPYISESLDGESWVVTGNGFGANGDLMRWEGANLGTPDACTKENGQFAFTTTREIWQFGAQLGSAAIETSDSIASDGTVTTTGIGGNGNLKTVTGSSRITSSRNYYSSAYPEGTTTLAAGSASVTVQRRTTGGTWTTIGTTTNNGEITRTVHPFTDTNGDNYVQETFEATATKGGQFTAATGPTYEVRSTGTTALPSGYVSGERRTSIATFEPG